MKNSLLIKFVNRSSHFTLPFERSKAPLAAHATSTPAAGRHAAQLARDGAAREPAGRHATTETKLPPLVPAVLPAASKAGSVALLVVDLVLPLELGLHDGVNGVDDEECSRSNGAEEGKTSDSPQNEGKVEVVGNLTV